MENLRLRCLELALEKVPFSGSLESFQTDVANMQDWFYSRIIQKDLPDSPPGENQRLQFRKNPSRAR